MEIDRYIGIHPPNSTPLVSVMRRRINLIGPLRTLIIDQFQKDVNAGEYKDMFAPLRNGVY